MTKTNNRSATQLLIIVSVLIVMFAFFALMKPGFASYINVMTIALSTCVNGLLALGVTFVITTAGIDLSIGTTMTFSCVMSGIAFTSWGFPIGLAIAFGFLVGAACGGTSGFAVAKMKLPPFIATLGMMTAIKGWCLLFTDGNMISTSNAFITMMGKGTFLGISYLTYIFAAIVLLASYVMRYTRYGRNLYATGGNLSAAKLSGINVNFSRFSIFAILGLSAGIAGAMFVCLMRAGSVLYGTDLSLTCVAATVVGGTPLTGGRGSVRRTVGGILLIYVLYKGLAFLGLQGYYNTMIRGIVLLLVVSFDAFMTRNESSRK